MDFYQDLNYSLGNEDWGVESQALQISPNDKVICITASGDRPLHFLMTACQHILSLDMNPAQNYLLNLKLAALTYLDYEAYLAFLGETPTPHRLDLFKKIQAGLTNESALFWQKHLPMIRAGILYQGKVERLTRIVSKLCAIIYPHKINTLFSFDEIKEQRAYVNQQWDTWLWRQIFSLFINPTISKVFLKDPGLNSFIDYTNHPGQYVYERMLRYLNHHLAKKSPLLYLLLKGKIERESYFPYLQYAGFEKIRKDCTRLSYQTDDIVEFLNKQPLLSFDAFSLSDIASYMPQSAFEKLLKGMVRSAKTGARFCIREFMSNRYIPDELKPYLKRNTELEKKLELEETNFVYRFMVGTITP